jgi:hypothetical protein
MLFAFWTHGDLVIVDKAVPFEMCIAPIAMGLAVKIQKEHPEYGAWDKSYLCIADGDFKDWDI